MLIAGISILIFVGFLLSGTPIAFAFLAAVVFMVVGFGYDPKFLVPYSFNRMRSIVILAIPLFILAGGIMENGKVTEPIANFINSIVSRVRGGLGAVGAFTCGVFGALSGSAAAAISCIGPTMIPRMEDQGYPRGYATAFITSAAGLALLIPPSIDMIWYGWLTQTSVVACFLAGTFPGIFLMLLFALFNWVMVGRMPTVKKPRPWGSSKQVGREFVSTGWRALPALLMPVCILGSIYGGIATPTEAAAVAVFVAILLGFFVYRGLMPKTFANTLIETGTTVGAIMLMTFGAMMLGRIFVMENVPDMITSFMMSISESRYVILLMINIVMIIIGMLMDDLTGMIISVALLLPVIKAIGISLVHFSAIVTTNLTMGLFTPPMAPLLYLGQRVGKTTFSEMIKTSAMLIVFGYLPTVLLVTYWPPLSMWLPELTLGARVLQPA